MHSLDFVIEFYNFIKSFNMILIYNLYASSIFQEEKLVLKNRIKEDLALFSMKPTLLSVKHHNIFFGLKKVYKSMESIVFSIHTARWIAPVSSLRLLGYTHSRRPSVTH